VTRFAWRSAAVAPLAGVLLLGACGGGSVHKVDPLTNRLAGMCGLDPQTLSYWGHGAPGFAGPPPYIWQTADAKHSVELAFPVGLSDDPRMFVSCDNDNARRPVTVNKRELPSDLPSPIGNGGG
jgi:hypothetical protein